MTASHLTPFEAELLAASEAKLSLNEWRGRQVAATATERDARALEKDEQREVRKLFVAFGCRVYWLSQARRTGQTPGVPDLWVVHKRLARAWWWETKRQVGGAYSAAQLEFRADCERCGVGYGAGDRYAARQLLVELGLMDDDGHPTTRSTR